ncbi:Asp23/Gls24 family envelope stress response protein [Ruania suaedae]|uniref:Asp23/Gls24 family envelope stress response protein n=1 Tax=Ruania suaedae TaxID=2897774 RepID=UPI001E5A72B5|nr:Asp23/Gls24 family envelope stress response protein [Ruania suaedae]UFU03144.1 Asp23/Gls24 family envelope stress response protein [Ruania suaedae]
MAEKSAHPSVSTDVERAPGPLASDLGSTTIADQVVSKIAGIATREVNGVHAIGGGAARAFGAIRERIPGGSTNYSQGVQVEVGSVECAVDVEFIAEYGAAIADVAEAVRQNIASSIQRMTGLHVVEVNVAVTDVHLQGEQDEEPATEPAEARVH